MKRVHDLRVLRFFAADARRGGFVDPILRQRSQPRQSKPLPLQGLDPEQQPGKKQCQADEGSRQEPRKKPAKHRGQKAQQHENHDRAPEQQALQCVEANKFALLKLPQDEENQRRKKSKIGERANPAIIPIHRRRRGSRRNFGSVLGDARLLGRKEISLAH